jgi:tRNA A-37 threonylcarbamoyl transferase component Bud32
VDSGDLTGAVLDQRYRVIERIAEGAMGVVYRAERIKLGRIVAVKVLHESLPSELASRKRFEIEAMAMARLEHPQCAAVLDIGLHDGKPFVVMDFVSGETLKATIANGPMPATRAVEIMRQVLSGLSHAHELGIIHRDIKPANLVLSQKIGLGDHVKILDFGLARIAEDGANLTIGLVVGTPSYMAPEQCNGGEIDARTDVYACGVVLFELLTGKKPFISAADDPVDLVRMHLFSQPPRLAALVPDIDERLEPIVAKALAKAPTDRHASAAELAAALEAVRTPVVAPPPIAAPPAPRWRPPAGALRLALIGGAGAIALIVLIAVATHRGPAPVPIDAAIVAVTPDAPPPPIVDPAADAVARATSLLTSGKREAALELLNSSRAVFPGNAEMPYLAGRIYFAKLWFGDGLRSFREAIRLQPTYRTDAELIKSVLRGFITTPSYDAEIAAFLRDQIGAPAAAFLDETARTHPSASIRARAAAELRHYSR